MNLIILIKLHILSVVTGKETIHVTSKCNIRL